MLLRRPPHLLAVGKPTICSIGTFAIRNSILDAQSMTLTSVLGYPLNKAGIPMTPIVTGLVLGPALPTEFRTALILAGPGPLLTVVHRQWPANLQEPGRSFSERVGQPPAEVCRYRSPIAEQPIPCQIGTVAGRLAGASNQAERMKPKTQGLSTRLTDYGDPEFSKYLRTSFAKSFGYSGEMLARPIVGIAYTASGYNNCHRHFPELLGAVKRGVLTSGALPLEFPTISLGEVFLHPTSMRYRNLMSLDTEEMTRAQPMDAVVLMGGCDKTVPAQLMGAASADVPAIQVVAGPMLTSSYKGERVGACTGPGSWAPAKFTRLNRNWRPLPEPAR